MATAWDRVASDRAKDLEEIMSSSNPNNFINDFMAKTSATLMKASGLPKWTTFGQGVNGTIAVDKILAAGERLTGGAKLSNSEITFLLSMV